jgi:hypothetical protein
MNCESNARLVTLIHSSVRTLHVYSIFIYYLSYSHPSTLILYPSMNMSDYLMYIARSFTIECIPFPVSSPLLLCEVLTYEKHCILLKSGEYVCT